MRSQAQQYRSSFYRLTLATVLVARTAIQPASLDAQQPVADPRDTTHAQKQAPFFTMRDVVMGAGFAAATVIMFPLDKRAAAALLDSETQANRLFKKTSTGVELITSPGSYIIGGSLYAIGRFTGN